ncbi:AMP-binding protein [Pseudonocardia halophobica]|uniref:AMP-binding protein n=1 Tax=Pseudonocardia halophobica TaxID=29401 RepID=UPI003D8AF99F
MTIECLAGQGCEPSERSAVAASRLRVVVDSGPRSLVEVVQAARLFASRPAIRFAGDEWTYSKLWAAASAVAAALRDDYDVRVGDQVGIAMRNRPEWLLAFWGTMLAGGVVVALDVSAGPEDLESLVRESSLRVIVVDRPAACALGTAGGVPLVGAGGMPDLPSFAHLLRTPVDLARFPEEWVAPDSPATLLFTCGAKGRPNGVVRTHGEHVTTLVQSHTRRTDGGPAAGGRPVVHPLFRLAGLDMIYSAAFEGSCLILRGGDGERTSAPSARYRSRGTGHGVARSVVPLRSGIADAPTTRRRHAATFPPYETREPEGRTL